LDGKSVVAEPGVDTVFTTPEGIELTVPAGAFDDVKLVRVTSLDAATLGVALEPYWKLGAYVEVDFEGTAKRGLTLKLPVTTSAPVGTLAFAGVPVQLPWGRRLQMLDVGTIVAGPGGQKLISNHPSDQPSEASPRSPLVGVPGCSSTKVCGNVLCYYLNQINTKRQAAWAYSESVSLFAGVGQAPGWGGSTEVFYNTYAETFVYIPVPNNWCGTFVLPMPASASYDVVRRDGATGWILSSQQYAAMAGAGLVTVPPLAPSSPASEARLVDATGVTLARYRRQELPGGAPPASKLCTTLTLEVEACSTATNQVTLEPSSVPLPEGSTVELYNLSAPGAPPISPIAFTPVSGASWSLAASPALADDLLVVIGRSEVDPDSIKGFAFHFDQLVTVASEAAELRDCGELPGSAACAGSVEVPIEIVPSDLSVAIVPKGDAGLSRNHRYRLTLDPARITSAGLPYRGPSSFTFTTRKAPSDTVGVTPSGNSLGDTAYARELLKVGNLLLAASFYGNFVAFDASGPPDASGNLQLAPWAAMTFQGTQIRGLVTDGHGRVFFSAIGPTSWSLKGFRIEDVRNAALPGTLAAPSCDDGSSPELAGLALCGSLTSAAPSLPALPIFSTVEGFGKISYALNGTSSVTASEFLAGQGLPMGTPMKTELVVSDDTTPELEVESFYNAHKPPTDPAFDTLLGAGGVYTFRVHLDSAFHLPPVRDPVCGEKGEDRFQRVTVDNLSTGESWSTDILQVAWGGDGKETVTVRGRKGDRFRARYNLRTVAMVAVMGSGISGLDLNRFYRTPSLVSLMVDRSQCKRRLFSFEGETLSFPACPPPIPPAQPTQYPGMRNTPAVAVLGKTEAYPVNHAVHVYSPLISYGAFQGLFQETAGFTSLEPITAPPVCLQGQPPAPRATLRDVAALSGLVYDNASGVATPRDVVFYALGADGVEVFDASDRQLDLSDKLGRLYIKDHLVSRLQVDPVRKRLLAGGILHPSGRAFIDVWDVSDPRDPVPPITGGTGDPRLLATLLDVPWSTTRLALDESGTGLLYTWDNRETCVAPAVPPACTPYGPGARLIPLQDPEVLVLGRYRPENAGIPPASAKATSVLKPALKLHPLGIPTRIRVADEEDPTNKERDEETATAAFKVRVALPGGLGDSLKAKVQSLRVLPDRRSLGAADASLSGLVGPQGGEGWPEREVFVTLKRLGIPCTGTTPPPPQSPCRGESGQLSVAFNLYESEETVLVVADPRALSGYTRQTLPPGGGPQWDDRRPDEANQCRRCALPSYLVTPPPPAPPGAPDPVVEVLAAGEYLRIVLADDGTSPATQQALQFFDAHAADYRRPAGYARLTGRADEIPSPMQASLSEPPQNPATWIGEAGASIALSSGETLLSTSDHVVSGRGMGFSFDRTYRSGVLGYGPLGAAGWTSDLFAHLREIVLEGEVAAGSSESRLGFVEYHDGQGSVFRFLTPDPDAAQPCPDGWDADIPEAYCAPVGLYMRLVKLADGGWQLFGRSFDSAYFDEKGRLTAISDRHRRREKDPSAQGSTIRLYYDAASQLAEVEDDLGRTYRFSYEEDPASPTYGLLQSLTDFAGRRIDYEYDAPTRRLLRVKLPQVTLAGGVTRTPTLTYAYIDASPTYAAFGADVPHHGDDFSRLRLSGYRLPDFPTNPPSTQPQRVSFTYGTTGRATRVDVPTVTSGWAFTYTAAQPGAPATPVDLQTPTGLRSAYTITSGHVTDLTHQNLEIAQGGAPVSGVTKTASFQYHPSGDGRLVALTRLDGSERAWTYADDPTLGSPTIDRMSRLNVLSLVDRQGSATQQPASSFAPAGTLYPQTEVSLAGYSVDNLPSLVTDAESRPITQAVPQVTPSAIASGYGTDNVSAQTSFDSYGRASRVLSGSGPSQLETAMSYGSDTRGKLGAGYLEKVALGAAGQLWESYDHDERGNVTFHASSNKTYETTTYDEWDRPVTEVTGKTNDPLSYRAVDQKATREYDEAGHVVAEVRYLTPELGSAPVPVRTEYTYDAREQLTGVKQHRVADASPQAAPTVVAEASFEYDGRGLMTKAKSAQETAGPGSGVVTDYDYDTAGRVKSVRPGAASGTRQMGYDALGRLTYSTDGEAGVWKGAYDAYGRLFEEELPTGALVTRYFDKAGGLKRQILRDKAVPSVLLADASYEVNSFGEIKTARQQVDGSQSLLVERSYDTNGRLLAQVTGGRVDASVTYEGGTGRILSMADAFGETRFAYGVPGSSWPDGAQLFESAPGGSCGAGSATLETRFFRDAQGRVANLESMSDGARSEIFYDEEGRPLQVSGNSGETWGFAWDGAGRLLREVRPTGRGQTFWGYDRDGRVKERISAVGASGFFQTRYGYDASGRLSSLTLPDGSTQGFEYYPDDVVKKVTRRDGVVLDYTYDPANRLTRSLPTVPSGNASLLSDAGETYSYDTTRMTSVGRLVSASPDVIATGTKVDFSDYDLAGRPRKEKVGDRDFLTRTYDAHGRTLYLGLPLGVGTSTAGFGYQRTWQGCANRLVSINAVSGPSTLGATWAFSGDDRLLGVTTNGPLKIAHRFGYTGGAGAQAPLPTTTRLRMATLTFGSAGTSDPIAEAASPLGSSQAPGSVPWGQFAYGFAEAQPGQPALSKRGRAVVNPPSIGTGAYPGVTSLLSDQGWAYDVDGGQRLVRAVAGTGSVLGLAGLSSQPYLESFTFTYGAADQVLREMRDLAQRKKIEYVPGSEGRPASRQVDGGAVSDILYEEGTVKNGGRRIEDDRLKLSWHWYGKLADVTVKGTWPTPPLSSVTPPSGQKVRYEYDALGRLFSRTHLAADGGFIERRELVFEGDTLVAEAAFAEGTGGAPGPIRWRKSYVPGAGLDDQVQLRVEVFDPPGSATPSSDRVYTFLRDEMGSVISLVEDTASATDPERPPVRVRYLYTPYGEAHAELGPELRSSRFDQATTSVTLAGGTTRSQAATIDQQGPSGITRARGAVRLLFSLPLDSATYPAIVVEKLLAGGGWTSVPSATIAIGQGPQGAPEETTVLLEDGWELGTTYQLRLTAGLKDGFGRPSVAAHTLQIPMPPPIPPSASGTYSVQYEESFPIEYETYLASAESVPGGAPYGLFPGGQNMLFQGAWTDPVTGLQYKRARWYDPRTASWLSEDHEDDVESPNVYAFVGLRPHEAIDPWGLARKTANGGVNVMGDTLNDVSITSETSGFEVGMAVFADATGNTLSTLLGLDTIADSAMVAGDSTRSGKERAWAAFKGIGTAAMDVAGGAILGTAGKVALRVPGAQRLASFVGGKLAGSAAGKILMTDVRQLGSQVATKLRQTVSSGEKAVASAAKAEATAARAEAAAARSENAAGEAVLSDCKTALARAAMNCFAAGTLVLAAEGAVPIETVELGQRVLTPTTTVEQEGATAVDESWKVVRYRLVDPKHPDDVIELSTMRPGTEVEAQGLHAGDSLRMDLEALDVSARAEVTSIEAPPAIERGPGRVVLSTIKRQREEVVRFTVAGVPEPLEASSEHPLFTERDWVTAGELTTSDRLLSASGEWLQVEKVTREKGDYQLFNFEVEGDHTYFVGDGQVLAHNCGGGLKRDQAELIANITGGVPDEYAAHHLLPVSVAKKSAAVRRAAREAGYNINRGRNGIALPTTDAEALATGLPLHRGGHTREYMGLARAKVRALDRRLRGLSREELAEEVGLIEDSMREALLTDRIRLQNIDPRPKLPNKP
jgi:RHS repeat-associated protein